MKRILYAKPSISDLEVKYVTDAIKNGWGENWSGYLKKFEAAFKEYLGVSYALPTASCTGATHLALAAMGIKPGDEVIVPDINWIASVSPALWLGAKLVFVDVLRDSWCIDHKKIEAAITPKTKAIIVVHLYGNVAEMDEIMTIARKHNIYVIEDAAESLGSEYKGRKTGSMGDFGVFSFHGTKTVSTGEGGMLVTNNLKLFEEAVILSDHGRDPKENKTFWMSRFGYKYKMSNLQAAMGLGQIERAGELIEKRRQNFFWYREGLSSVLGIAMNPEPYYVKNSYWMPTVIFDRSLGVERDDLLKFLKENNIDGRPFFYPLTSLPMFAESREKSERENTISYGLFSHGINLPSYYELTKEEADFVCAKIKEYLSNRNAKSSTGGTLADRSSFVTEKSAVREVQLDAGKIVDYQKLPSLREHVRVKEQKNVKELEEAGLKWSKVREENRLDYELDWLGIPLIQSPEDLILIQELIFKVRPDVIVEVGIAHGGSLIYYSSLLELINPFGKIIGVEIDIREHNRKVLEQHPLSKRIELIEGSSIAEEVFQKVKQKIPPGAKVLVCLDSDHTKNHVLNELRMYHSLVSLGSYVVVFDSCSSQLAKLGAADAKYIDNGPWEALQEFLKENRNFRIDEHYNKLFISASPDGYLKRIS